MLFDVDVLDPYLDDVTGLEEVGGVAFPCEGRGTAFGGG